MKYFCKIKHCSHKPQINLNALKNGVFGEKLVDQIKHHSFACCNLPRKVQFLLKVSFQWLKLSLLIPYSAIWEGFLRDIKCSTIYSGLCNPPPPQTLLLFRGFYEKPAIWIHLKRFTLSAFVEANICKCTQQCHVRASYPVLMTRQIIILLLSWLRLHVNV